MSSINFDNVYLLFIAIPLLVLLTVPFIIAVRKDNRNGHNIASMVIHVLLAVLIAFTAAGTSIVTVMTETDIYVVADVSYSANKNLDTVDGYIYDLSTDLPKNSRMGVICFGKNYKLITRLGESLKSVKEADVDDSETDIIGALNYAASLFRTDVIKRIVLITDGKATDNSDSSALRRTVEGLAAEGIHVDAIYLDDNITESVKEVQISDVDFTSSAYLNHDESVICSVQSSYNTNAIAAVYRQGERVAEKAVTLTAGVNSLSFPLDTSEVGSFDYEVRIAADEDANPYNNSYYFTQNVTGEVNVLLIADDQSDYAAAREIFGDKADITAYIGDSNVPCSIEALCRYDEIVLSDVDVASLNNYELFLQNLDTVVSLFGKSLITLGDTSIQNKIEGELKMLSDMLPVRFGNVGQDKKLYTIVLDSSRSMFWNSKFTIAKTAAKQLVDFLDDGDSVCIVTFYGDVKMVQAPVTVGANREQIKQNIDSLEVIQGTNIGLGLYQALQQIYQLTNFSEKQLMLITDGLNYIGSGIGYDPIDVTSQLRAYGVATSVIDIGRGSDTGDVATKALDMLKNIASIGGGNYYYAPTADDLNEVIFGGVADTINETVIERNSWVTVKKRSEAVVEGIDDPLYISGYVNSSAKASATTVLTVDYQTASGTSITVPLYSYWNYGNGKVATFTSKLSGSWIRAWTEAGLDEVFFGNVFEDNIPDEKKDYPFNVQTDTASGYTTFTLTPATIRSDATATVTVITPDGEEKTENLIFDASSYVYGLTTAGVGRYTVTLTYSYADNDYVADASFTVSYLPEYDSFAVFDASVLHKAIDATGTVSENGKLSIVNDEKEYGTRTITLTVPLLIACVALFAVDIIIRKLKWNDIVSLFGKVGK